MGVKALGSTQEVRSKLLRLNLGGGQRIPGVEVRFVDIGGIPVAKALTWTKIDAEVRKRGEQTGLDTLVVRAVNDEC